MFEMEATHDRGVVVVGLIDDDLGLLGRPRSEMCYMLHSCKQASSHLHICTSPKTVSVGKHSNTTTMAIRPSAQITNPESDNQC